MAREDNRESAERRAAQHFSLCGALLTWAIHLIKPSRTSIGTVESRQ